ncbi:MAG: hypothetical protein JSR91_14885 [Proteobacteria bacterium]|nr:hypothetical protein [Pseudomonadota bacterium]
MPIQFAIDHDKRFVHARTEGIVTLQDIEAYLDAVVVQDAMPYPKLFDCTDIIAEYSDDEVMLLGARVSAYAALDPRGPVAFVAVTDQATEIVDRFINLGGAKRPAKLFRSEAEARKWLATQPAVTAPPTA